MKTKAKLVLAQACLGLCYLHMCKVAKSHELAHLILELILVTLIKLQGHPEVGWEHMFFCPQLWKS